MSPVRRSPERSKPLGKSVARSRIPASTAPELPAPAIRVDREITMLTACDAVSPRVCASVHALPFRDRVFAGALCHRLLQHIPTPVERIAVLRELAQAHALLVTVEEHQIMGGAGGAVCEALAGLGLEKRVLLLGLPDRFIDHGDPAKLLASVGLDAAGIEKAIRSAITE